MHSLLQSGQPIVLFVLVLVAVFLLTWQLLFHSRKKPAAKKTANWSDSAESGSNFSEASQYSMAEQANPDAASVVASSSDEPADPSGIVAEVCSLQSPVRENVEESYRGRRVRWTLSLSAISETKGQGATHTVRMHPSGRSPYSCGVYFDANETACAVLQAAGKKNAFVVEGTIAKVEDRDIDLTDVRMLENAA